MTAPDSRPEYEPVRSGVQRSSPPGSGSETNPPDSGSEAKRLLRDMFAFATLPATWAGAEPARIGASLLAAVDATVHPPLSYFRLEIEDPGHGGPGAVEMAHVEQRLASAQATEDLGGRIAAFAATRRSDELVSFPDSPAGRPLVLWIQPLGPAVSRGVLAVGFEAVHGPTEIERMLLTVAATQASVACRNALLQAAAEAAREEAQALRDVTRTIAAELDLSEVAQKTIDSARRLTGAQSALFLYESPSPSPRAKGDVACAVSGVSPRLCEPFQTLDDVPAFAPGSSDTEAIRIDDIEALGRPDVAVAHFVMAKTLSARSYLAVPVVSRSGVVLGGLFLGNPENSPFGGRAERIATGIARQASIAMDNARLFARAEAEIIQRQQVEQTLRKSEERYRRLAQLLPVAVYTCDAPDGRITYFNDQAAETWGRVPEPAGGEIRFCGSFGLFRSDGTPLLPEQSPMAVALRQERELRNEEVLMERPDGSRVTALVSIDPVHDDEGKLAGAVGVFHDVTAHKQAELELREQKENLETLLETLPVAVFITQDAACGQVFGNPAASNLLRMPTGANLAKNAPPGERPTHFNVTKNGQAYASQSLPGARAARGEVVEAESIDIEFDDGSVVHALVSARPLYDSAGRPRGAVMCMLDITSLKRAEWALRQADRRKDEFLATLAHELRNPLAPVRTSLELMKQSNDDVQVLPLAREAIERQVNQLVRLVDDLLDVSRITRDRLELRREKVELRSILEQALETCRPLAMQEAQTIQLELSEHPVQLNADGVRLTQVFGNLLNNACKYTPHGGTIRLSARRYADEVVVEVEDDGIGIPAEEIEGVFDMFAQVGMAVDRSRGGLGIGLTLVKRLVEMHEGSVIARSAGVGRGSTFAVRLPIWEEPVMQKSNSHKPVSEGGAEASSVAEGAERSAASTQAKSRRVLVVDDNEDAAQMLAMLLELWGHDVRMAHDGIDAVEEAEKFLPQLVLLDIGLPRLNGVDACRRIRAASWSQDMVIVALSGWGQEGDRQKTKEAGFDDHLIKPVDNQALSSALERVV